MFKQTILMFAVWSSCGLSALAADYPAAYDATYTQLANGDKTTMKVASNGKGIMKTVMETRGGNVESLIDYPGKMTTTVMYLEHMWMKVPLKEPYKDENALKKEGKSLGTKAFNGHTCNGYETKSDTGISRTWIGNDNHVIVHFEKDTGLVKNVTDLTSFSDKAGDVALVIPKDFQEIK